LFLQSVERSFDFQIGYGNFWVLGPQLLVAHNLDFGHYFEAGFEMHGLAFMRVKVGDARLRDGNQAQPFRFLAEEFGNKRVHYVVLDILRKPLANDRGGHMTAAESWDTSELLILLNQGFGFARDFLGGYLDLEFALRALGGLGWTHGDFSKI